MAELDIVVADIFLHDSSIEKEILVVTKMLLPPRVYLSAFAEDHGLARG
jgi:hypothetical protein